jgi:hypothetical protein
VPWLPYAPAPYGTPGKGGGQVRRQSLGIGQPQEDLTLSSVPRGVAAVAWL